LVFKLGVENGRGVFSFRPFSFALQRLTPTHQIERLTATASHPTANQAPASPGRTRTAATAQPTPAVPTTRPGFIPPPPPKPTSPPPRRLPEQLPQPSCVGGGRPTSHVGSPGPPPGSLAVAPPQVRSAPFPLDPEQQHQLSPPFLSISDACVSAAGQLRALRREGRGGGRGLCSGARGAAGGGSGSRRRVAAGDVDQGEEHAEQGGEADGEGDRPHAA